MSTTIFFTILAVLHFLLLFLSSCWHSCDHPWAALTVMHQSLGGAYFLPWSRRSSDVLTQSFSSSYLVTSCHNPRDSTCCLSWSLSGTSIILIFFFFCPATTASHNPSAALTSCHHPWAALSSCYSPWVGNASYITSEVRALSWS